MHGRGLVDRLSLMVAGVGFLLFVRSVALLYPLPRTPIQAEMQVALPRFVQVLMSGGDRYLAANLAGFRALVVSTENMKSEDYHVLGLVQSDAAWFNPSHEDNYYIAAAILPWNGQVDAAQYILEKATEARPFDWAPPFYYGFNMLHFSKQPLEAARWLTIAGRHAQDQMDQILLQQMAASWATKGEDPALAVRLIRAMAKDTRHKSFAKFLNARANLLEEAAQKRLNGNEKTVNQRSELVDR